ncbi:MAG TPA: hypothetical protein VNW92_06555 [Polyangiaceae bacterium]|nr:hypothetical protein [Polyangiaceae bacterium]
MQTTSPRDPRVGGVLRLVCGLALTPSVVAVCAAFSSRIHVGALGGNIAAFAGATLIPILALAIAASAEVALAPTLFVAVTAIASLIAVALVQPAPLTAVLLVDGALVGVAWACGTSLGRRVQHASHLLPACVVAASADIVSLLSPEGPTHAIVKSDRALTVLAVWFPVPGSSALAPALGVGDLLFIGLVFGVAVAHHLPYARTVLLAVLGTSLAGLAAAWLGVAVPALVPIAAAILLGLPMVRNVRPADRSAAKWSVVIAGSIVLATVVRGFFSR